VQQRDGEHGVPDGSDAHRVLRQEPSQVLALMAQLGAAVDVHVGRLASAQMASRNRVAPAQDVKRQLPQGSHRMRLRGLQGRRLAATATAAATSRCGVVLASGA